MAGAPSLESFPVHLGLGARALALPEFTGTPEWYQAYEAAQAADGAEGRLVSLHRFETDWAGWEMHPGGDEVVVCIEGAFTLVQELADGTRPEIALAPGNYAINPAGVWHTARAGSPCAALFITAGAGTRHRTA